MSGQPPLRRPQLPDLVSTPADKRVVGLPAQWGAGPEWQDADGPAARYAVCL
jgi:hypothetical protein